MVSHALMRYVRTVAQALQPGGEGHSADAQREHATDARALRLPPGLSLCWLGTAGFALSYQNRTLVIDPHASRSSMLDVLRGRRLHSDPALLERFVPRADAVLVGHTHFDHALDVPAVVRRDGCKAYGSRSLQQLMHMHGLGERAVVVEHGATFAIGPFEIAFVDSLHAKLALGLAVPQDGEITCEHVAHLAPDARGMRASAYRCGQVYGIHIKVAGARFYHQGSANLIEERIPAAFRGVDYLLMGIAGRRFTRDFTLRTLQALQPAAVVPTHYDDFFQPLGDPLAFSANVRLDRFVDEVGRVSRDFRLCTLERSQVLRP